MRTIRLASGLVLLAYVTTHLLNHALLAASIEAADAALDWNRWFWRLPVATVSLYGALAIHAGLGLWSLYERPRFAFRPGEAVQLALGLALPPLLVAHVVGTRLAFALDDTKQGYAQLLYHYWITEPGDGIQQALALAAAWLHGWLGLQAWLRLKPWFQGAATLLVVIAVLLPTAGLFGYAAGGREVRVLAADESWRVENAPVGASTPEGADRMARLRRARDILIIGFGGLVGAALLGRVLRRFGERRRGRIRLTYPDGRVVIVPRGTNVLEASRRFGIRHASICGGRGRCSTCRVRVAGEGQLPEPSASERAVLDRVGAEPGVRLACQLRPAVDLRVYPLVAPEAALRTARRADGGRPSEERFVVVLFADMRGSTRLAERHLPFDTVFVINRFLDAVSRAVVASGGSPNQFLGDGLLALFGLGQDRASAARGALAAVGAIGREVQAMNRIMATDAPEPIRFGIGVHAGLAILGEIGRGDAGQGVFTAIGDPVNVAARLQGLTKRFGVEAAISDAVFEVAGVEPGAGGREVDIEGRAGRLPVRLVEDAAAFQPGPETLAAA